MTIKINTQGTATGRIPDPEEFVNRTMTGISKVVGVPSWLLSRCHKGESSISEPLLKANYADIEFRAITTSSWMLGKLWASYIWVLQDYIAGTKDLKLGDGVRWYLKDQGDGPSAGSLYVLWGSMTAITPRKSFSQLTPQQSIRGMPDFFWQRAS
jgi:hypothetical protein